VSGLERRLAGLYMALGHRFRQPDLLRKALTHPSVDTGEDTANYERLEFLGDRVLGLVIARMLFERFPHEREGSLARRHTALVRAETLTLVAQRLDLGSYIVMSEAEENAGGRNKASVLANCCEAVIAALYLDGGMYAASRFIRRHWRPLMSQELAAAKDPKTALQEWAQKRGLPLPTYTIVDRAGPDHEPVFSIQVQVPGLPAVTATGRSKRVAERAAAASLLNMARQRDDG